MEQLPKIETNTDARQQELDKINAAHLEMQAHFYEQEKIKAQNALTKGFFENIEGRELRSASAVTPETEAMILKFTKKLKGLLWKKAA